MVFITNTKQIHKNPYVKYIPIIYLRFDIVTTTVQM